MMLDEPYRWAEAVANRREYIEDQLRRGSPVVGVGYRDGALLLTLVQGQQKIFEVYDRIGMGSLGHPTDIEKLRQAAVDLASVIGFNYSEADVTLQQIVHFGLGPTVKTAFDEIFRSPYIVRVLMAELDGVGGQTTFYTVNYDGAFHMTEGWGVVAGVPEADRLMQRHLADLKVGRLSLRKALDAALLAWAAGRWAGQFEDKEGGLEEAAGEANLEAVLRTELEALSVEAAVFQRSRPGKGKYRRLDQKEVEPALKAYRT